jgi:hypothetical protein
MFKVLLGMISIVSVVNPWSSSVEDSCSKGEVLVETRESCVFGWITQSITCELVEGEEEAMKSLISSSLVFS